MSSIDKLLIQGTWPLWGVEHSCDYLASIPHAGIRSFGVREEDKSVIQFYTPLTLITGQNGAGKTVRCNFTD